MNPLPPMRRIFIMQIAEIAKINDWKSKAIAVYVSLWTRYKNLQRLKVLNKFVEIVTLDEGNAANLDRFQSTGANALHEKFARQT